MSLTRRENRTLQERFPLEASTVAAVSATGRICLGTADRDYAVDKFELMIPGGYTSDASNYYDISLQVKGQTTTATAATDTLTTASAHGYSTGDSVQFVNSGGGLPAGLSAGVTYFVVVVDSLNYKVADTLAHALAGTNIIDITTAGTGTQTASKVHAMWSLLTGANGTLTDIVFSSGTLQSRPVGLSGEQLDVVFTKFAAGVNVAAGTRLVAHLRYL